MPRRNGKRLLALRTLAPLFNGDQIVAILNWCDQVKERTSGH